MSVIKGALYVVATPIGNLADMSFRAIDTLRDVDVIAAEDTRHSGKLLHHYGIDTPCIAFHEHNEREVTPRLLERLAAGEAVALISDAGTPLIRDPGYQLVSAAHGRGLRIIPIPGPSAVIAALSAAGLPTDRFAFEGYLPPKEGARRRRLEELTREPRTLVFYEAPHRIAAAVRDMADAFGSDRPAAYARELTKAFETLRRGPLGDLAALLTQDEVQRRGEFVVVVQGLIQEPAQAVEARSAGLLSILLRHLPLKTAVAVAAEISGERKNLLYQQAVRLSQGTDR